MESPKHVDGRLLEQKEKKMRKKSRVTSDKSNERREHWDQNVFYS
jgi:hypothetical protein